MEKRFLIYFLYFISFFFHSFSGGSSKSSTSSAFLRDQFSTKDGYKLEQLNVLDKKYNYKLAYCGNNGVNFCDGSKNVNCCLGDSNFGYASWVSLDGKDYNGYKLAVCFAFPDQGKISYKCQSVNTSDSEVFVNLGIGKTVNIKVKLLYFDAQNPGFGSEFNPNSQTCGCTDTKNATHCAGYALLPYIIEDSCNIESKVNARCSSKDNCPCDDSCVQNNYLPPNFNDLDASMQACYLCNKIGYIAEKNCKIAKKCYDNNSLSRSVDIFRAAGKEYYGEGYYLCGYIDGQRAGCAKLRPKSGPRHFNKVSYLSKNESCKDVDLKTNPQCNLFEDLPYVREFRDYKQKNDEAFCVNISKDAELGSSFRGTFFRPKLIVKSGENETIMEFIPNEFTVRNLSRVYNHLTLDSKTHLGAVKDSIKATPFGSTIYRIKKGYYSLNANGNCSIVTDDSSYNLYDILVRLEYNEKINESSFAAYVITEVSDNTNDYLVYDNFKGDIKEYVDNLKKEDFISDQVYVYNVDTNQKELFNKFNKRFFIKKIGKVQRPTIRHFYNNNFLKHPISINPNLNSSSSSDYYFNPYLINLNPADSVDPNVRDGDLDYNIPQDFIDVYISKNTAIGISNTETEGKTNCDFMYGHKFCIGNDSCSVLYFIDNDTYLLNPPVDPSLCDAKPTLIEKMECNLAYYLVPSCNDKIFCNKFESREDCQSRVGLKLFYTNSSDYKYNKSFQDKLYTCLINYDLPNHIKDNGNIARFGPYGYSNLDTVLAFKRKSKDIGFSTRPVTKKDPDYGDNFLNDDIFRVPNDYFLSYKGKDLITKVVDFLQDSLKWVLKYTDCTVSVSNNSCLENSLYLRPIEPEEWPKDVLCSSLIYNKRTSSDFSKSRLKQEHDFDLYLPLRCQTLRVEMWGAGGGGTSERKNQGCYGYGGYIDSEMPKMAATGCSAAYVRGYLNQNNDSYNFDYLSLQIGERTRYCTVDKYKIDPNAGWDSYDASKAQNYTNWYFGCQISDSLNGPWLQGGCHVDSWRGDTVLNLYNSLNKGKLLASKAGRGGSQLDYVNNRQFYARQNVTIVERDGGCIAGMSIAAAAAALIPFVGPGISAFIGSTALPLTCFVFGPGNIQYNDQCPGKYTIETKVFDASSKFEGNQLSLSTGLKRVWGNSFESYLFAGDGKSTQNAPTVYQTISDLERFDSSSLHSDGQALGVFNIDNEDYGTGGAFNDGNGSRNFSARPIDVVQDSYYNFKSGPVACQTEQQTDQNGQTVQVCKVDSSGNQVISLCKDETTCTSICPTTSYSIDSCVGTIYHVNREAFLKFSYKNPSLTESSDVQSFSQDIKSKITIMTNQPTSEELVSPYLMDESQYRANQQPINYGANNDNSLSYKKYSGGGGSGRIIISIPTVKHLDVNKKEMRPFFDTNGKKVLCTSGDDCYNDIDCKLKCPRIHILFRNKMIEARDKTLSGDLICEYSGDEETDMEIIADTRVHYPKKCYINSKDSQNTLLKSYHGYVVSSGDDCPVIKCKNGIINVNSRLYGMCARNSTTDLDSEYKKAISSNGNAFSGYGSRLERFYTKPYEERDFTQLSYCVDLRASVGIIYSKVTINANDMMLTCNNGFWEDVNEKEIVNTRLSSYYLKFKDQYDQDKDYNWAENQPNQARIKDANENEPESYFREFSIEDRRVFKKEDIKCPPLIALINYDSDYTGNAEWPAGNYNEDVVGTCKSGYSRSNGSNPRRHCSLNGIWGKVENPCIR